MTNIVYEIVKVTGLGFKECMYEYYSLGLLYYNKEEAENNAKILWEKETTDEERNSRWCAVHFVVKERQIIGSPETIPENTYDFRNYIEVNSLKLKKLAEWLQSDEGKKAIKDGLEKADAACKIIDKMNDIDPKILKDPFTI
jgi:hypothetical protein